MKFGKLSFANGFSVVQNGMKQATVNAKPTLIANSTQGKFTITAPVSKAMNLAAGEYIMFVNNEAIVEKLVSERDPEILNYIQENNLNIDIETYEGQKELVRELTTWGIAKGYEVRDKTNAPIMVKERYSQADKEKFLKDNAAAMLDELRDVLISRVGDENATDEELIASLTVDDIEVPQYALHKGAKTSSNTAGATIGVNLGFTDTQIWSSLKEGMTDKKKQNRIFDVAIDKAVHTTTNNGFEEVPITVFPIEFASDEDITIREKKD